MNSHSGLAITNGSLLDQYFGFARFSESSLKFAEVGMRATRSTERDTDLQNVKQTSTPTIACTIANT